MEGASEGASGPFKRSALGAFIPFPRPDTRTYAKRYCWNNDMDDTVPRAVVESPDSIVVLGNRCGGDDNA